VLGPYSSQTQVLIPWFLLMRGTQKDFYSIIYVCFFEKDLSSLLGF